MSFHPGRFERAIEILRAHFEREEAEPVAPYASPADLERRIDLDPPEEGLDDDEVFARLEAVVRATPRTTTRRFHNQLFSGRDEFGSVGEMLAVFLNSSMYTFKAAGPQVMIERRLAAAMGRRVGYPDAEGTFAPGGSLSNLSAMLLARNARRPQSREAGLDGRRLTFYASKVCHYSVPKAAGILGIGREQLRRIEIDGRGRMRGDALRDAVRRDLEAGHEPFLVIATSGTTVLGAFDPLDEIADVAGEFDLWMHVDGALGGSVAFSERHRRLLRGSERSDSFTWDAHKLLGLPLSCSAILTRERGPLRASLDEKATYLFQSDDDAYDLGRISLQCGRRNDALKLWAAWQHHGALGFGRRIDRLFELARHAADRVRAEPGWALTREPESVNVCFEVEGRRSRDICERLRREGRSLVGFGVVDGREVIRLAVVNGELEERDLDVFFDEVAEVATRAERGDNARSV